MIDGIAMCLLYILGPVLFTLFVNDIPDKIKTYTWSPLTWKYLETWENLEKATFSIQNLENGGLGQVTER